jgi:hypothetical protein
MSSLRIVKRSSGYLFKEEQYIMNLMKVFAGYNALILPLKRAV